MPSPNKSKSNKNSNKKNNDKKKKKKDEAPQKASSSSSSFSSLADKKEMEDPPMECTEEEFDDLLQQAAALTPEEARSELIDCARYGEVDAVRAVLDTFQRQCHDDHDANDNNHNTTTTTTTPFIDAADASGNTALHKSSANNRVSTARLLLSRGASAHRANHAGNTPLHWAAAAGHFDIVRLLLSPPRKPIGTATRHHDADVLKKNEFGRSALTEGFGSGNTEVVRLLLEHDSATEERLLGMSDDVVGKNDGDDDDDDDKVNEVNDDDDGDDVVDEKVDADIVTGDYGASSDNTIDTGSTGTQTTCAVHEFQFVANIDASVDDEQQQQQEGETKITETSPNEGEMIHTSPSSDNEEAERQSSTEGDTGRNSRTLLIRELPIANADDPFGKSAAEDTTGLGVWCASLVMARWLASPGMSRRLNGMSVLELGAGCGVPGLACAAYSNAKSICVTDLNPTTVRNLQHNVDLNKDRCEAYYPDDGRRNERVTSMTIDWDDESTWPGEKLDFVIGSDLIYQSGIVPSLKKAISGLVRPDGGTFLYVAPDDGRDGLREFIRSMKNEGFVCVNESVAPDSYCANPLYNQDEDECFLHFHELASTTYVLYEFKRL